MGKRFVKSHGVFDNFKICIMFTSCLVDKNLFASCLLLIRVQPIPGDVYEVFLILAPTV